MYTATGEGQKLLCDLHQVNWVWTFVLQKKWIQKYYHFCVNCPEYYLSYQRQSNINSLYE